MAFWRKQADADGWTAVVFGAGRIAVAEVVRSAQTRPQVHAFESYASPEGEAEALRRLKSVRRLTGRRCTTLLQEGEYHLLQVDPPANAHVLPRDELREALRWQVKEMVDFSVDQAGIDLLEIPTSGSRAAQFWVVVASHDVLQPCIHRFQEAEVSLAAIDIPELAQRNLAGLFEEPNRGLACVAFNARGGLLTVTHRGELCMTRHIDVGAPELAGPAAGALHERVLLDIQRSLDNFDRNYSSISLTRLLIGPLPNGAVFADYLRNNLSLPVANADLTTVMDCSAVPQLADAAAQADAWPALGAALRE